MEIYLNNGVVVNMRVAIVLISICLCMTMTYKRMLFFQEHCVIEHKRFCERKYKKDFFLWP